MGEPQIDLLEPVRILHEHLTEALCEQVFDARRVSERRRVWTLTKLAEFWTAVILRAPSSLHQALEEAFAGSGGFPHVETTKQAFFERAKDLRWEFFRDLHARFTERLVAATAPTFEVELRKELAGFPEVFIADGTTLDRVAHRLKVLWDERTVVLPGKLLVLHDLFRGLPRVVEFHEDAKGHEVPQLKATLDAVPRGSLILGDRLYCVASLFGEFEERGLHGLIRRKRPTKIKRLETLGAQTREREVIEDLLVLVGSGRYGPKRKLRMIRLRRGSKVLELLTDVLDPAKLPADVALRLYRRRWKIERLFYDLKVVLNLRRFYAANANAVAMQVYAAAIVYAAMRAAQAKIAAAESLPPERLSTKKLFPRIAAASYALVQCRLGYLATCAANTGQKLTEPDWADMEFARALLEAILSEPRNDRRRRRRRCPARERSASLHVFVRRRRIN
jgi:Transposase DDE domain